LGGEGGGVEGVEDEVVVGHAKGVERNVRRRCANFVLTVEGKVQRRERRRRREDARKGVDEVLQRT